tara:strand:- start:76 stop:243 length:168 start_codon:yes stop_codon:yes gene_type:complete
MHFKPFQHHAQIDTMDGEVLWEKLGRVPEDIPLEEINQFFRQYIRDNSKGLNGKT